MEALGHYQKMYELLPSDTGNKTDFMDDVLRIKNKLMEIKQQKNNSPTKCKLHRLIQFKYR